MGKLNFNDVEQHILLKSLLFQKTDLQRQLDEVFFVRKKRLTLHALVKGSDSQFHCFCYYENIFLLWHQNSLGLRILFL